MTPAETLRIADELNRRFGPMTGKSAPNYFARIREALAPYRWAQWEAVRDEVLSEGHFPGARALKQALEAGPAAKPCPYGAQRAIVVSDLLFGRLDEREAQRLQRPGNEEALLRYCEARKER